jgi:hypothetical protein
MQDGKILERADWMLCAAAGASLAAWVALTDFTVDPCSCLVVAAFVLAAAPRAAAWSWPKLLVPSHALIIARENA